MSTPVPIIPSEQKPVVADSITITGIFASSSISKTSGHQTVLVLSGGKPTKVRSFYADPSLSRLVSGSFVKVVAHEIEYVMSDFNGLSYGSRRFDIQPVQSNTTAVPQGGPALEKKAA
ncbi:hypothetical protein [Trichlorobacter ammonificans]|uniref:Uncharacterized protein n=1 Tax=Trichlorobacter ammonificans TaxID=2916410 RepID=A0ABM9DBP3_9BACT|nr:hypothetical protein [Trichlorobacter ammonificans]CAH2032100.1 protein of unknown function [Trichlorobacter ammonificans]